MLVKITPNDSNHPPGKLADAEIHFGIDVDALLADLCVDMQYKPTPDALRALRQTLTDYKLDELAGLKLIGFGIWERRTGGGRNVAFPARQYSVNGERRSFALLRPIEDATAQNRIRALILEAYAEYEERAAVAV